MARHETSTEETAILERQLFGYSTPEDFAERLLDFGCGNGASTMTIGRLLPRTEVVGVELSQEKIEMANRISAFRSLVSHSHANSDRSISARSRCIEKVVRHVFLGM